MYEHILKIWGFFFTPLHFVFRINHVLESCTHFLVCVCVFYCHSAVINTHGVNTVVTALLTYILHPVFSDIKAKLFYINRWRWGVVWLDEKRSCFFCCKCIWWCESIYIFARMQMPVCGKDVEGGSCILLFLIWWVEGAQTECVKLNHLRKGACSKHRS